MRKVISKVLPGSRVLVALVTATDSEDYWRQTPAVRRIDGIYIANYHLPAIFIGSAPNRDRCRV
jgi:hypothetical protein